MNRIIKLMNEEQIQAARAAFARDPEAACVALLGKAPEEVFIEALRGCNQHKHKPGCPHRKKFREDAYSEYMTKREELMKKYGGKWSTNKQLLEEKLAELDAELLAKLKSKNADA